MKIRILKTVAAALLCAAFASSASARVDIAKAHKDQKRFAACTLKIDGKPIDVYECQVSKYPINQVWPGYQRDVDQIEPAGFAYWDTDGATNVEITVKKPVDKVVVRPLSYGIKPQISGNKITFTLEKIRPVAIELGSPHNMLHLFPNPILTGAPKPKTKGFCCPQCSYCSPKINNVPRGYDPHFYYFGEGIHDVGTLMLKSDDTVYIEAGAVVYGSLVADDAKNIRVFGRGILDGGHVQRANLWARGGFGNLHFRNCENVKIDGIILRDPNSWGCNIRLCKNVEISNIKFIGYWRYNSDGIDIWNSSNVVLKDCFIRAYDDSVIVRVDGPNNNDIHVSGCVIWNDWGISLAVEADGRGKEAKDISFSDIDIIRPASNAMLIGNRTGGIIKTIRYKNINVEFDNWLPRQVFQKKRGEVYKPDFGDKSLPNLFNVFVARRNKNQNLPPSTIDDIVFDNINLIGNESAPSRFTGLDEERRVGNVLIKNLKFNGKKITDFKGGNILGRLADKVKIE